MPDFLVNHFLDILHQFIITNDYLHFSSYFRQSKILSDINGRRTLRGPTYVDLWYATDRYSFCHCIFVYNDKILVLFAQTGILFKQVTSAYC